MPTIPVGRTVGLHTGKDLPGYDNINFASESDKMPVGLKNVGVTIDSRPSFITGNNVEVQNRLRETFFR